jgi:hypothetical protein
MGTTQSSLKTTYRSDVDVKSTPRSEPPTPHSRRTDGDDPLRECTTEPIQTAERSTPPTNAKRAAHLTIVDEFYVSNEQHREAREAQVTRAFEEAARLVGVKLTKVAGSVG